MLWQLASCWKATTAGHFLSELKDSKVSSGHDTLLEIATVKINKNFS